MKSSIEPERESGKTGIADSDGEQDSYAEAMAYHRAQRRVDSVSDALLVVLEARDISFDNRTREVITRCTGGGMDRLKQWLARAATATSIDEVFARHESADEQGTGNSRI